MASRYRGRPAVAVPDLIDLSDSEELYSVSEGESTQRNFNDRRLAQAINYLTEEGGDDSPATFIDRVDRIDAALLQQLPKAGGDFDPNLWSRVHAMVREVQRDFEDAAEGNSGLIEEIDDDDLPEHYTPSAAEHALYKEADEAEEPLPKSSGAPLKPRRGGSGDNVQREREFKYGGPSNEVENWHRNFPASLPFPETLQMAHWESLKIDFDLSNSAKTGGKIVETNVPFDHPQLEQYKALPQYDSGSRFKLPVPTAEDEDLINQLGSEEELQKVVDAFNRGDRDEEITKDYAPRVFLDRFIVGRQVSPTAIRRSVNVTPTKPRQQSNVGAASSVGSAMKRTSEPKDTVPTAPAVKSRAMKTMTPTSQLRASAVARRLSDQRAESIRASPRRESAAGSNKETPGRRIASHVAVQVPQKRGRGRPPKDASKAKTPEPVVDETLGKRKRSIGSEPFTPDAKRKRSLGSEDYTPSALKKKTRSAAKKKVDFAIPLESSAEEDELPMPAAPKPHKAKAVSKAAAAGKQVRKKRAPRVTEEKVTESEYERRMRKERKGVGNVKRGTTRSGATFK